MKADPPPSAAQPRFREVDHRLRAIHRVNLSLGKSFNEPLGEVPGANPQVQPYQLCIGLEREYFKSYLNHFRALGVPDLHIGIVSSHALAQVVGVDAPLAHRLRLYPWHFRQKLVMRCPAVISEMREPQRGQASPPLRWTRR